MLKVSSTTVSFRRPQSDILSSGCVNRGRLEILSYPTNRRSISTVAVHRLLNNELTIPVGLSPYLGTVGRYPRTRLIGFHFHSIRCKGETRTRFLRTKKLVLDFSNSSLTSSKSRIDRYSVRTSRSMTLPVCFYCQRGT